MGEQPLFFLFGFLLGSGGALIICAILWHPASIRNRKHRPMTRQEIDREFSKLEF